MATTPKPTEALSPIEIMAFAPIARQDAIERLIASVNAALKECVTLLSENGYIDFQPSEFDRDWLLFHADMVEHFRTKDWIVEPIFGSDERTLLGYRFRLPGHMLSKRAIQRAELSAVDPEREAMVKVIEEASKLFEQQRKVYEAE